MQLGFIGLGNMGSEMARHLLAAGHTISTYARGERSRAHANRLGLKLLASPAEVARASEVVFTMVTAGSDVESVALELAHDAGLPLPVTAQVMQQLNALMGSGFGGQDTSSLLLVLEQMRGRTKPLAPPE